MAVTRGRNVVGRTVAEALPEATQYVEQLREVMTTGVSHVSRETRRSMQLPNGSFDERYINTVWQPVRGGSGNVESLLVMAHDVTEVVRARQNAEQIAQREKEHRDFEQQLIGIVSHDLKNPLAAISLATEVLLRRKTIEDETRGVVQRIRTSVGRAICMVRDILDFTQARLGGGLPVEKQPTELGGVIEQAAEELRGIHPGREIVVELQGEIHGSFDSDRIAQVVTNLAANALAYGARGTPIVLRGLRDANQVVIEVHNQGTPIPEEARARMFEHMQRATSKLDAAGRSVGLGLYIVRHLVEAHGGKVSVESVEGHGTTFRVELPRV